MLCLRRQLFPQVQLYSRFLSTVNADSTSATKVYPYFVPRNSRGNIPVYTDVRNGGTRRLIYLRNVEGNINALVKDIRESLFLRTSPERAKLKIEVVRSKNLTISGGRWKNHVVEWVKNRGF